MSPNAVGFFVAFMATIASPVYTVPLVIYSESAARFPLSPYRGFSRTTLVDKPRPFSYIRVSINNDSSVISSRSLHDDSLADKSI